MLSARRWAEPVRAGGRVAEELARHAARMAQLVLGIIEATVRGRVSAKETIAQAYATGVASLPLVFVTSILSGVVTSQQGGYQFSSAAVPMYVLGSIVTSSIVLELGPVMTAFVLIGRVGARITAELGTMRVSEQIDALEALGREPVQVLVTPRLVAGLLVTPVLVGLGNAAGVLAGMIAAAGTLGLSPESFFYGARLFWHDWDLFYSLCKGLAFGGAIPLVSCYVGLATEGGAEGVG